MRYHARYESGWAGIAPSPVPECSRTTGFLVPGAGTAGSETKVGSTSLLPGGMTLDAGTGLFRFLHDSSPEPVIGFGAAKGLETYYRAVREFGSMPVPR